MTSSVDLAKSFDLQDPELSDSFYPVIDAIRQSCPVAWSDANGGYWLVSGYAAAHRILTDPETFSSRTPPPPAQEFPDGPHIPQETDAPEHTMYRHVIVPGFSPQRVAQKEEEIRAFARQLLGAIAAKGHCEWVSEFAGVLPAKMVLDMLGFPWEDVGLLNFYKEEFFVHAFSNDPAVRDRVMNESRPAFRRYVQEKLDERRAATDPPPDALTAMLFGKLAGKPQMTDDEITRACMLLIPAGLDTVAMTLTFMASHLAQNPAARKQLRQDPTLIPGAVEEYFRITSVVSPPRKCTRDVEVGGMQMRKGDVILLSTASAGRDEKEFPSADEVRFDRTPNRHMAFGLGPHRCLGSNLARLEIRVALEEMMSIIPDFELAPGFTPRVRTGVVLAIEQLELTINPS